MCAGRDGRLMYTRRKVKEYEQIKVAKPQARSDEEGDVKHGAEILYAAQWKI